jgi:hypothetical protein
MTITVHIDLLPILSKYCSDVNLIEQQITGQYILIGFDPTPDLIEKMIEAAKMHGYLQAIKQTQK